MLAIDPRERLLDGSGRRRRDELVEGGGARHAHRVDHANMPSAHAPAGSPPRPRSRRRPLALGAHRVQQQRDRDAGAVLARRAVHEHGVGCRGRVGDQSRELGERVRAVREHRDVQRAEAGQLSQRLARRLRRAASGSPPGAPACIACCARPVSAPSSRASSTTRNGRVAGSRSGAIIRSMGVRKSTITPIVGRGQLLEARGGESAQCVGAVEHARCGSRRRRSSGMPPVSRKLNDPSMEDAVATVAVGYGARRVGPRKR